VITLPELTSVPLNISNLNYSPGYHSKHRPSTAIVFSRGGDIIARMV